MSADRPNALESTRATDEESPGVPLFRTWRGVYWFVFGCFAAAVLALTIFSQVYA
jgi:hypothetical protein